jgi:hypothetical protein
MEPKPELTKEEEVLQKVEDLKKAILEDIKAGEWIIKASAEKKRTQKQLSLAKQSLYGIDY